MKNKTWVLCVAVVAAFVLSLGGSVAQAQSSKMDVFGGYSFGTNSCFGSCYVDPALNGYALSFAYNFNRYIGLEASFSGHNGTPTLDHEPASSSDTGYTDTLNQNIYVYTFGPRFTVPVGNFSLFSHILVGATHVDAEATYQCLEETGDEESCGTPSASYERYHGDGFAAKVGGGVDWNHGRWGIRILEADYIHGEVYTTEQEVCSSCQPYSFDSSGNAFEMSAGVKFNFGGMK